MDTLFWLRGRNSGSFWAHEIEIALPHNTAHTRKHCSILCIWKKLNPLTTGFSLI